MKASELLERLQNLITSFGDLEVEMLNPGTYDSYPISDIYLLRDDEQYPQTFVLE